MSAPRLQILASEMSDETRRTALAVITTVLAQPHAASETPTRVSKALDAALSPHWSCIAGPSYSFNVCEDSRTFLNVKHRNVFYTVWRNRTVHARPEELTLSGDETSGAGQAESTTEDCIKSLEREARALVDQSKAAVDENKSIVRENMTLIDEHKTVVQEYKALIQENKALIQENKALIQEYFVTKDAKPMPIVLAENASGNVKRGTKKGAVIASEDTEGVVSTIQEKTLAQLLPNCLITSTTMPEDMAHKVCGHVHAVLSTSPASLVDAMEAIAFRIDNLVSHDVNGAWDVLIGLSTAFIPHTATPGTTIVLSAGPLTVTIYHYTRSFDDDKTSMSGSFLSKSPLSGSVSPSAQVTPLSDTFEGFPGELTSSEAPTSLQLKVPSVRPKSSATDTSTYLTVGPQPSARPTFRNVASAALATFALMMMML